MFQGPETQNEEQNRDSNEKQRPKAENRIRDRDGVGRGVVIRKDQQFDIVEKDVEADEQVVKERTTSIGFDPSGI